MRTHIYLLLLYMCPHATIRARVGGAGAALVRGYLYEDTYIPLPTICVSSCYYMSSCRCGECCACARGMRNMG
jgi:hypothetical protein